MKNKEHIDGYISKITMPNGKVYALQCTVVEAKPITCTHCGAPVELHFGSGKCEYCGTFYTTNFEVVEK